MRGALASLLILTWLAQPARAGVAEAEQALKAGDEPAAVRELTPLAERGQIAAQFNLGLIHARSIGAVRDLPAAYKWFSCAAGGANDSSARETALKWRDYVKGIMRRDEIQRAESMTAAACKSGTAPAAPNYRTKEGPSAKPPVRVVKAEDGAASSPSQPVAARAPTRSAQSTAPLAARSEPEYAAPGSANRNGFDIPRVFTAIKPVALFMGDLTIAGILQLGSAAGTTSIVGIVNRMMTAYGNWFTGAVSLAWWIVAIKSLHLLLTRRRFGRRSKANVQTIT